MCQALAVTFSAIVIDVATPPTQQLSRDSHA